MAYGNYATITIDKTKVSGGADLSSFPVLISGTYDGTGSEPDLRTAANGGDVQNANGYDIAFFSDEALTTQLDHEIESYTATTGAIAMWVRVPTLSASVDTVIYMGYGDSSISTTQENASGVWDANFVAVYHLNGSYDGTAGEVKDSTSNVRHGVAVNGVAQADGRIGKGQDFETTSNQYINLGNTTGDLQLAGTKYTISAHVRPESANTTYPDNYLDIISCDDALDFSGGYKLQIINDATSSRAYWSHNTGADNNWDTGVVIPTNQYSFINAVYNQTNRILYLNDAAGVTRATTSNITSDGNDPVFIGATPYDLPNGFFNFDGIIDELRVSKIDRSAGWIGTDYNSQTSPSTFYAMGTATVINNGPGAIGSAISLSDAERKWFMIRVTSSTPTTPLNDLKRSYFVSKIGGASANVKYVVDLEKQWLRSVIVTAGGTPSSTQFVEQLWKEAVSALGYRVSRFVNENKLTFYLNYTAS